jgi:hypothetical protein
MCLIKFIPIDGTVFIYNTPNYMFVEYSRLKILDDVIDHPRHFLRLFIHGQPQSGTRKYVSNKLIDLYNFVFNTNVEQTHRAKGDTILIVDICKKLNLSPKDLIKMYDNIKIEI